MPGPTATRRNRRSELKATARQTAFGSLRVKLIFFRSAIAVLLWCSTGLASSPPAEPSSVASWNFAQLHSGAEEWLQLTEEQRRASVQAQPGCCLQGVITARDPFIQSPVVDIDVDDKHIVAVRLRLNVQGAGRAAGGVMVLPTHAYTPGMTDQQLSNSASWIYVSFSATVVGDGHARIMYAPIWKALQGRIALIRVVPAYASSTTQQQQQQDPRGLGNTFEIEWIKVVKAPTITRVTGCLDKHFEHIHEPPEAFRDTLLRDPLTQPGENDTWFGFLGSTYQLEALHEHWLHRIVNGGVADLHEAHISLNADAAVHATDFRNGLPNAAYAVTYNCQRGGGDLIRIQGRNFGGSLTPSWSEHTNAATITIGGRPCVDVSVVNAETWLECRTPPVPTEALTSAGTTPSAVRAALDRVHVQVRNRDLDGLIDMRPYFAYVVPAPPVSHLRATNTASRSVDLVWGIDDMPMWDALTVTGFVVQVLQESEPLTAVPRNDGTAVVDVWSTAQVVSNVTTTTVRGLAPDTPCRFRVAPLSEDQKTVIHAANHEATPGAQWSTGDLYGRRSALGGAVVGAFSSSTDSVRTLKHDVDFAYFNANASLSHGPHSKGDQHNSEGLSKDFGSQGHFGLRFVGQASIANCNASHTCCDKPNSDDGDSCDVMCTSVAEVGNVDGVDASGNQTSQHPNGLLVSSDRDLLAAVAGSARVMTAKCGSTLRLTGSLPRSTGAAWYGRQLNVREGFTTEFTFRVSDPSQVCSHMNDVKTHCRYRGADGFAFVLQTNDSEAIGRGGDGLGYAGLSNAVAVEFDTHFNAERNDPYDNHVAVFASGRTTSGSDASDSSSSSSSSIPIAKLLQSEHAMELASTTGVQDLSDGATHAVRITYVPRMNPRDVQRDSRVLGERAVELLLSSVRTGEEEGANTAAAGVVTGGLSMGVLRVFVDDMSEPVLTTALNMETALELQSGRAWIGFTAATGETSFQTHDILQWSYSALREEVP